MDRLSPLDAAFLLAEDEDPNTSMAIASVAVIDGTAPTHQEIVDLVRDRLPMIPRWRQKVHTVPLDLGLPFWVDAPDVDLAFHVRRTALPAPGDEAALCALTGRIMSQRMDRDHPLWEMWVVEGLSGDRWALVAKMHHSIADGVAGTRLYELICTGDGPTTVPEEPPSASEMFLRALGDLAKFPVDQARMIARALQQPGRLLTNAAATVQGLLSYATAILQPTPPTSLVGHIGRQRRYAVARVAMPDVISVSKAFRVTINDVVLAAISGAYRDLLLSRGEKPVRDSIRTFVPVNVREKQSRHVDNRISAILAILPVDVEDPVERLSIVHERLSNLKAGKQSHAGAAVTSLAGMEMFPPIAWVIRAAAHIPQRSIITVTTNVPGPRKPLALLGREIQEIFPYVPIGVRLLTGIAILTYRDRLAIGVTADFDTNPDTHLLTESIEREMTALVTAAARRLPIRTTASVRMNSR